MVFKKKLNVVLLTTKTLHHRYFIKILEENIPSIFFKNPKTNRLKKFLDQVLNY